MKQIKWTLEAMQQFCNENNLNVKVLKNYRIDKGYQKVLYATLQLPNGDVVDRVWNNFKNHTKNSKVPTTWDQEKVEQFFLKQGYTVLGNFKDVDKGIKCKDRDGFIYYISVSNLKRKIRNDSYNFSIIKNNKDAITNIQHYCQLYRPDYEILSSEYKGVKEKYLFRYNGELYNGRQNREFYCTLDYFLHGEGGINMNLSKGAQKIAKILKENNYNFCLEKTYPDFRSYKNHNFPYRYDFCVNVDGKEILIEYDSELHFKFIPCFHRIEQNFREAQERDRRKNSYCLANQIPLYRIPYWDLDKINSFSDICIDEYKVKNRYHNDYLWRKHQIDGSFS